MYLMIWPVSVYLFPFAFSDSHLFVQLAHTIITVYVKVSKIYIKSQTFSLPVGLSGRGWIAGNQRTERRQGQMSHLSFSRRAARDSDLCLFVPTGK